jgi:hypothetical protein
VRIAGGITSNPSASFCIPIAALLSFAHELYTSDAGAPLAAGQPAPPRFSFASLHRHSVWRPTARGQAQYRKSPGKGSRQWTPESHKDLAFAIQLGDLIDSRAVDLDPILAIYNRLVAPQRHVLGNHDFAMQRDTLVHRLGMPGAYYEFAVNGWRFLVMDGMDLSVADGSRAPGTPQRESGQDMFEHLRAARAPNANDWNGGIGPRQLDWLRDCLKRASRNHERVGLFCHHPVLRESSTPAHLLWNHETVRQIWRRAFGGGMVQRPRSPGQYAVRNGIHYVTFPGMVESANRTPTP